MENLKLMELRQIHRSILVNHRCPASPYPGPRHHPDIAGNLDEHHGDSPTGRRPTSLLIGYAPVEMLHREGIAYRPVGTCLEPLRP
jgi:hypothetical protein